MRIETMGVALIGLGSLASTAGAMFFPLAVTNNPVLEPYQLNQPAAEVQFLENSGTYQDPGPQVSIWQKLSFEAMQSQRKISQVFPKSPDETLIAGKIIFPSNSYGKVKVFQAEGNRNTDVVHVTGCDSNIPPERCGLGYADITKVRFSDVENNLQRLLLKVVLSEEQREIEEAIRLAETEVFHRRQRIQQIRAEAAQSALRESEIRSYQQQIQTYQEHLDVLYIQRNQYQQLFDGYYQDAYFRINKAAMAQLELLGSGETLALDTVNINKQGGSIPSYRTLLRYQFRHGTNTTIPKMSDLTVDKQASLLLRAAVAKAVVGNSPRILDSATTLAEIFEQEGGKISSSGIRRFSSPIKFNRSRFTKTFKSKKHGSFGIYKWDGEKLSPVADYDQVMKNDLVIIFKDTSRYRDKFWVDLEIASTPSTHSHYYLKDFLDGFSSGLQSIRLGYATIDGSRLRSNDHPKALFDLSKLKGNGVSPREEITLEQVSNMLGGSENFHIPTRFRTVFESISEIKSIDQEGTDWILE